MRIGAALAFMLTVVPASVLAQNQLKPDQLKSADSLLLASYCYGAVEQELALAEAPAGARDRPFGGILEKPVRTGVDSEREDDLQRLSRFVADRMKRVDGDEKAAMAFAKMRGFDDQTQCGSLAAGGSSLACRRTLRCESADLDGMLPF